MLEFTEYINSLYPTIKFELVYSKDSLNVLDLTLHLKDGLISTDIYSKPTDSHLYLPYSSSHPKHCKTSIPYGVALRLKRNCSNEDQLNQRCFEYKMYLKHQGYSSKLVDKQFNKALAIDRNDILKPRVRVKNKVFPLVLDYNPRLPDISNIISSNIHFLESSPILKTIFPGKSIMPAYRRTKNLKDILAPSKFKPKCTVEKAGCYKCTAKRCDLCSNFLMESDIFSSTATGKIYKIKEQLSCTSSNIIYIAQCIKCSLQYVGSTSTQFKVRFRNHKSAMKTNKNSCEVAVHFNSADHSLSDFKFVCIEALRDTNEVDKKLLTREAYWMAQLSTLHPHGLNKRAEFRSKNRINFN